MSLDASQVHSVSFGFVLPGTVRSPLIDTDMEKTVWPDTKRRFLGIL